MKTLATVLFIIISGLRLANAQNWILVNPEYKYNYKTDTSQFIDYGVWIDSSSVSGGDSAFFLNRIVTDCDTCTSNWDKLYNQPTFMQRKMIKVGDGVYRLLDYGNFVIHTKDSVNSSWLFDSTNNIMASITAKGEDSLFGLADSFKIISLQGNGHIIISKSFGIISYPIFGTGHNFNLVGINGLGVGEQALNFWSVYDLKPGDILCYYNYTGDGSNGWNGEHCGVEDWYRQTILTRTVSGDTLLLTAQIRQVHHELYMVDGHCSFTGESSRSSCDNCSIMIIDSSNHMANAYPRQIFLTDQNYSCADGQFSFFTYAADPFDNKTILKSTGTYSKLSDHLLGKYWYEFIFNFNLKKGLGLSLNDVEYGESGCVYQLTSYVFNGDTSSNGVCPEGFFTEIDSPKEPEKHNTFNIYPNPTADIARLDLNFDEPHLQISFTDIESRTLLLNSLDISTTGASYQFDVSQLSSGIYLVKISDQNGLLLDSRKLVIMR